MTAFFIATTALASIIAAYFAWDWNRMRRERNSWRAAWRATDKALLDMAGRVLDTPARGPDGRFVKRK